MSEKSSENKQRLIWSKDDVKEVYFNYGFWPNYIGHEVIPSSSQPQRSHKTGAHEEKSTSLPLPVYLWKEQYRFMKECQARPVSSSISKKRKAGSDPLSISDIVVSSSAESETKSPKRRRVSFDWFGVGHYFEPYLQYLSSIFYRSTPDPGDNRIKADTENSTTFKTVPTREERPSLEETLSFGTMVNSTMEKEAAFRYQVFTFLQREYVRKGNENYLLGSGDVYGADYSLYKGVKNPAYAHSIASILIHSENKISPRQLLGYCRIQNQVAKSAVIIFPGQAPMQGEVKPLILVFNFRNAAVRI